MPQAQLITTCQKKAISSIVSEVREWAEALQRKHAYRFPRLDLANMCSVCALRLFIRLQREGYAPVYAQSHCHAFVLCNDLVLDVTATQFGLGLGQICILPEIESKEYDFWEVETTSKHLNTVLHIVKQWPSWDRYIAPFLNAVFL